MKVADLQEDLKKGKDPTAGLKVVLLAWLKEALSKEAHMHREIITAAAKKSSSAKKTTGVYSVAEYYWWKVLGTSKIVEEPTNPTFKLPYAPTVSEEESKYIPQKFDFAEKFDRPLFEGRVKRKVGYANGTIKDNRGGTHIVEEVVRYSGCIDP